MHEARDGGTPQARDRDGIGMDQGWTRDGIGMDQGLDRGLVLRRDLS